MSKSDRNIYAGYNKLEIINKYDKKRIFFWRDKEYIEEKIETILSKAQ